MLGVHTEDVCYSDTSISSISHRRCKCIFTYRLRLLETDTSGTATCCTPPLNITFDDTEVKIRNLTFVKECDIQLGGGGRGP